MFRAPQFTTGDFESHHAFLDDDTYGKALDTLVKAVSDILISSEDGERLFLGCRKVEPQPDWWFVGGRARPGDTTQAAAARNVKRELGLAIDAARFEVLAHYSFVWRFRQQAPQANGTADVSTVHTLRLTAEEAAAVKLDEREYRDSRWIATTDVIEGESFHPALRQAARDLLAQRAFRALQAAVAAGADDAAVATAARELVARNAEGTAGATKVTFEAELGTYTYVTRGEPEGLCQ